MMNEPFKRVILYARQHRVNQDVTEALHRLVDFLKTTALDLAQDEETKATFGLTLPVISYDALDASEDLIVVVGGDGSLLSAARMAIKKNIAVIGINRGRLGFLTDISPQNMEQRLTDVLKGKYSEESRFLLEASIHDEKQCFYMGDALNDVVLGSGAETHLIEFAVLVSKQFVSQYRADGLIISTPTGSTAYALSAGGPIMHPKLNAMVIVPMFSHSLNSRPLVVDGEAEIVLQISPSNERELQISCDGHESHRVKPGQLVTIKKNKDSLRLLHPTDYHYYDTLRIKLGWGSKPQG